MVLMMDSPPAGNDASWCDGRRCRSSFGLDDDPACDFLEPVSTFPDASPDSGVCCDLLAEVENLGSLKQIFGEALLSVDYLGGGAAGLDDMTTPGGLTQQHPTAAPLDAFDFSQLDSSSPSRHLLRNDSQSPDGGVSSSSSSSTGGRGFMTSATSGFPPNCTNHMDFMRSALGALAAQALSGEHVNLGGVYNQVMLASGGAGGGFGEGNMMPSNGASSYSSDSPGFDLASPPQFPSAAAATTIKKEPTEGEAAEDGRGGAGARGERKSLKTKTCRVCGDHALGYNFGVISCESCKAFFRRNAHRNLFGRCKGSCDVTKETRSYCRRCRLRKCYDVGMQKEMIVERNKRSKSASSMEDVPSPGSRSSGPRSPDAPLPACEGSEVIVVDLGLHATNMDPSLFKMLATMQDNYGRCMQTLMTLQKMAFKQLGTGKDVNPCSTWFINSAEGSICALISYFKTLPWFMELHQADQIVLLQENILDSMILFSGLSYDPKTRSWSPYGPDKPPNIGIESIEAGSGVHRLMESYIEYMGSLMKVVPRDLTIFTLMLTISLFSSDCDGLQKCSAILESQELLLRILQAYLKAVYPTNYQTLFAKVMSSLIDIRQFRQTHTEVVLQMNPSDVSPLLQEMYRSKEATPGDSPSQVSNTSEAAPSSS